MKQFRLVLNGIAGEWLDVNNVKLETMIRTGNELTDLGFKDWFLEWRWDNVKTKRIFRKT